MTDDRLEPPAEEQPRKGSALLAWVVILAVVTAAVWWQNRRPARDPAEVPADDPIGLGVVEMQGLYLVGAAALSPAQRDKIYEQAKVFDRGPPSQRLRFVVLAGELDGPREALNQLRGVPLDRASADQREVARLLGRLYTAYEKDRFNDVLDRGERQRVVAELGWFGELALTPAGHPDAEARQAVLAPALRTVYIFLGVFFGVLALGLLGLVGLLVLLILLLSRRVPSALRWASPHGAVYAETFAVWLVLFVGLLFLSSYLPPSRHRILFGSVLSLLSLVALGWPVWRGVPWAQVKFDVGLTARRPFLELVNGFVCYVVSLPFLVVGLLIMMLLMRWLSQGGPGDEDGTVAHPILGVLARGDAWVVVQALLAACVVAPLVEETMFRGVFYRHLREATRSWGLFLSLATAGLVNSLVFAVVHPQGLIAVPVLMGLALGFTLAREWRGSLVPGMVAHSLNNGLVTLLILLTLRR